MVRGGYVRRRLTFDAGVASFQERNKFRGAGIGIVELRGLKLAPGPSTAPAMQHSGNIHLEKSSSTSHPSVLITQNIGLSIQRME